MKFTLFAAALLSLTALSSQAAVSFTGISQENDASTTTTTLQNRSGDGRNSIQALTGTAITESTPYTDFSFVLTLTGGAAAPTPGLTIANLTFTVTGESVAFSNAQADSFFKTDGGVTPVVGTSGILVPGDYFMTATASGSETVPAFNVLSLTIPEPSSALLSLLGFAAFLRRRR